MLMDTDTVMDIRTVKVRVRVRVEVRVRVRVRARARDWVITTFVKKRVP